MEEKEEEVSPWNKDSFIQNVNQMSCCICLSREILYEALQSSLDCLSLDSDSVAE